MTFIKGHSIWTPTNRSPTNTLTMSEVHKTVRLKYKIVVIHFWMMNKKYFVCYNFSQTMHRISTIPGLWSPWSKSSFNKTFSFCGYCNSKVCCCQVFMASCIYVGINDNPVKLNCHLCVLCQVNCRYIDVYMQTCISVAACSYTTV